MRGGSNGTKGSIKLSAAVMLGAVVLYFALNLGSSVSLIVVNKYVFSIYHFNYPTVVTFVHFVLTA